MGTYATTTSLDDMMIGTTFDTATTALVTKAIDHAETEIDKYLSKRYDVSVSPFLSATSVPPLVTSLCERMAMGYYYWWNSRGGKDGDTRGQSFLKEAKENLQQIADYKLDLLDINGDPIADMSNTAFRIKSSTETYSSTFDEDSELDWAVDSDKLSDIYDGRS